MLLLFFCGAKVRFIEVKNEKKFKKLLANNDLL